MKKIVIYNLSTETKQKCSLIYRKKKRGGKYGRNMSKTCFMVYNIYGKFVTSTNKMKHLPKMGIT
jgi:hypothetical protein